MAVPYTFGTATASIPLSQLDSNFATAITLGNTAIQLGNTVTTLNNMTLANVTISSGNITLTNVSATTANVTTANVVTMIVTGNETVLGNTTVTGTATAAKLIPTGTSVTGNGMYLPATNSVGISTAGTNAVYIDASQNVGIGTSSPINKLQVTDASVATIRLKLTANANGTIWNDNASTTDFTCVDARAMTFGTSNAERMRIDSSGNLLVGGTTAYGTTTVYRANDGSKAITMRNTSAAAGKNFGFVVDSNNTMYVQGTSGGVYLTDTGTAWVANSDERLKTALIPFENAVEKICTLRSGTGRYLIDDESVSRSFLIAQDVQKVLPEAVNIQNDEQGTLGLAYSDLIPLMTKAIQEQQALITSLTARIEALEAK
jgi:hypothetical protein